MPSMTDQSDERSYIVLNDDKLISFLLKGVSAKVP